MTDSVKYDLGQLVYSKVDPDLRGIVTGILFRPSGMIYLVSWSGRESEGYHYEMELTIEKKYTKPEVE